MAKVFIEETTLTNIGNAIRGKEGTTELIPVNDMATRITAIQSGAEVEALEITSNGTYTAPEGTGYSPITVNVPQDGAPTDGELIIKGNCSYRFSNDGWNWVIKKYGNRITTQNITDAVNMFNESRNLTSLPFELNFSDSSSVGTKNMFYACNLLTSIPNIDCKHKTYVDMGYMFTSCERITTAPAVTNAYPSAINSMFEGCYRLRTISEDFFSTWNFEYINSYKYASWTQLFYSCRSLRKHPDLTKMHPITTSSFYSIYVRIFQDCYALDEITNVPVSNGTLINSEFGSYPFHNCYRVKNITFNTNEDGSPIVANWQRQTIDLRNNIGYSTSTSSAEDITTKYNSGITMDKAVYDDATYQALKNDPDWFACYGAGGASTDTILAYSRYNHDSAVATINSLPDTSAYLASVSGTNNNIIFKGASGSATDGGAINTLTEEEIAVATAKGWTVTLV